VLRGVCGDGKLSGGKEAADFDAASESPLVSAFIVSSTAESTSSSSGLFEELLRGSSIVLASNLEPPEVAEGTDDAGGGRDPNDLRR
jgi:hypothetical protein